MIWPYKICVLKAGNPYGLRLRRTFIFVDDISTKRSAGCVLAVGARLNAEQSARVGRDTTLKRFPAAGVICHRGAASTNWIGVISGAVKVESISNAGRGTTLATMPSGSWFGEGTLLKQQQWPFDAVCLIESEIALMPSATFHWLLATSLPFNRFLLDQLNARLGQFVERCQHERLYRADKHVAHCLIELFDPDLYPNSSPSIPLSQEELARLSGVSRTLVNRTLRELEALGLVKVSYGAVTLTDPVALRRFSE